MGGSGLYVYIYIHIRLCAPRGREIRLGYPPLTHSPRKHPHKKHNHPHPSTLTPTPTHSQHPPNTKPTKHHRRVLRGQRARHRPLLPPARHGPLAGAFSHQPTNQPTNSSFLLGFFLIKQMIPPPPLTARRSLHSSSGGGRAPPRPPHQGGPRPPRRPPPPARAAAHQPGGYCRNIDALSYWRRAQSKIPWHDTGRGEGPHQSGRWCNTESNKRGGIDVLLLLRQLVTR